MKHIPNILTFGRIVLVPFFVAASMQHRYAAAFVIFLTAAVTDVLDGMLARKLNVKSRLGALLDPAADKTLMVCGFLYYTFAARLPRLAIPGWLTFTVFIRDFLIIFFAYVMYTRVHIKRFPPSALGKLSTLLQASTIAGVIGSNAFQSSWLMPTSEILFRLSLLMTLASGWGYMRRAALLVENPVEPARA